MVKAQYLWLKLHTDDRNSNFNKEYDIYIMEFGIA